MSDNVPLAVAYYLNGSAFRKSAEQLAEGLELDGSGRPGPTKLTAVPMYFLASHAAELFLKAALLKRDFAEADLKKTGIRHNLTALLQEIKNKGVLVRPVSRRVASAGTVGPPGFRFRTSRREKAPRARARKRPPICLRSDFMPWCSPSLPGERLGACSRADRPHRADPDAGAHSSDHAQGSR
jgi:hypothetical protein